MNQNGLPVVIEEKCTGCGECVSVSPQYNCFGWEEMGVHIRCRSLALGKEVRKVCQVAALPAAAVRKNVQ